MVGAFRFCVEDGTATLRTRNGHDYSHTFPELARTARGFDNCIIDGEVCSVRKDGITDFSQLQAAMKAGKTAGLMFFAFDLLFLGDQDLRTLPLMERKKQLLDAARRAQRPEDDPVG